MKTKKKFKVYPLTENQSKASDPKNNVWVQANAGTGKTEVLNARLLRILFRTNLYGSEHPGILCLTYTKVGASEMKKRILESLRNWVMADDENLKELLKDITENTPTDEDVKRAKQIFYQYIDNQDIIKVKTIHSFCEEILQRFSLEAGLSPSITAIEEVEQRALSERAFERLLTKTNTDSNVEKAIDRILDFQSESFLPTLYEILKSQYKNFFEITDINKYREEFSKVLKERLNISDFDYIKSFRNRMHSCIAEAQKIKDSSEDSKIRDFCDNIIKKTQSYLENKISYQEYAQIYITKDKKQGLIKKELPENAKVLNEEADSVLRNSPYQSNKDTYENTMALFDISAEFSKTYKEIKKEMEVIDFDDMILYVEKLFDSASMGYVLSTLDSSLGHILVDEAQDTSLHQWNIFYLISSEIIPDGEKTNAHSLFAVGDTKQAIFGFSGADRKAFDETKKNIKSLLANKNRNLEDLNLEESFRTASPILNFVDYFFGNNYVKELTHFENNRHKCFFKDRKGIVELHPFVTSAGMTHDEYADFLVNQIKKILNTNLNEDGSAFKPGDILILVRNRSGAIMDVINQLTMKLKQTEYKGQPIKVAGADTIVLNKFNAAIDLLNIIRFGIKPSDNFSLCAILNGPLYRFSDSEIQKLCIENKRINEEDKNAHSNVFKVIESWAVSQPEKYGKIYTDLKEFISRVSYEAPYSFFSWLLQKKDDESGLTNRQKFISAYGKPVIDPLEDFMTICLSYERTKPGTLKDFLKWFITSDIHKNRTYSPENGINIISAHKSKGLTTPITMLIGTNDALKSETILKITDEYLEKTYPDYKFWLWNMTTSHTITEEIEKIVDDNYQEALEEHYRLLYVAMTRSKYGLYIYGYGRRNKNCWYATIESVFNELALNPEIQKINAEGNIKRITKDDEFEEFFRNYFQQRNGN
ncbi:MAG: UvrD-helicase domain-containing protein [Alphaproteobacteria bacterium]|nr:UvrD-helicase domain-containing protein [Alphaproteobacteria bacterium]